MRFPAITLVSLAVIGLSSGPAHAGESYDNCSGFITSLPTTISTQGVWCMDRDLATGIASGAAITIANNNVTLDCNGFKLGGLAAGTTSAAHGVYAYGRLNATVRNCNIRGFSRGVFFEGLGGGGHVVEDSRFDGNLYVGISVEGEGSVIRRNLVMDTGGLVGSLSTAGILGNGADVFDNVVNGVTAAGAAQYTFGIAANGMGVTVARNTVRNVISVDGYSTGISAVGYAAAIRDNSIANNPGDSGGGPQSGIKAGSGLYGFCIGNTVGGYSTPFSFCLSSAGNQSQ